MQTITKISKQKHSSNRYNIFLNEQYAFSVSKDVFIKYHLQKGQQLSDKAIEEIVEADHFHRSYLLAIHYLSYRMRSISEVRTYLFKKETDPITIDRIIERLQTEGLLNEYDFAKAFVKDRINQTLKGPIMIEKELQEKGVTQSISKEAIRIFTYEKQLEQCLQLAKKESKKKTNQSYVKRKEQLKNKLLQRGYYFDVVDTVMQDVHIEKDEEKEREIFMKQAKRLYNRYNKKHEGNELTLKVKAALYNRGFSSEMINDYVEDLNA